MAKVFLSDSILTNIANAIRGKLGTTGTYKPSEMPAAINSIETGGSGGIDTSDATATAGDIVKPKTAYVKGEKVTGGLVKNNSLYLNCDTPELSGSNVQVTSQMYTDTLVESGGLVYTSIPATEFGNAEAGDVAKGKTFTSAAGVKTVGTKEDGSLPTLNTPADASNIEEGKEAIDGTGNKIIGTLSKMVSVGKVASTVEVNGDNLEMSAKYDAKNIFDTSTRITLKKSLSTFGTATAADVAKGKVFTSAAGLNVTGTGTLLAAEDYDITNAERFSDTQEATTGTLTINFSNYHRAVIATIYFMTSETAYYKANLLVIGDVCIMTSCERGSNASFTTGYDCIFEKQIFKVSRSGNSITFSLDKVSSNMKYYNKSLTSKSVTISKMGNSNMNYVVYGV